MTEVRADELVKGDVVLLRGERYTVVKARSRGKHVRLVVDGRRGSFESEVKGRTLYDRVDGGDRSGAAATVKRAGMSALSPRPLHDGSGAQTRWATRGEAADILPPADPVASTAWDHVAKADRPLVKHLGAKLVGVEVEGGKLVVPPVTDATLFGHLLLMHGVRFDGVTVGEAKAWARANDPGGDVTAEQVITALSFERARELHDRLHVDFAAIPRPHWHRDRAPK